MRTILLTILCFIAIIFVACKKDPGTIATEQTPQQQILGKWKMQANYSHIVSNGVSASDTFYWDPQDFMEFKTGGKVTIYSGGMGLDGNYGFINDQHIWLQDTTEEYEIITPTDTDLKLYTKHWYNAVDYEETTIVANK